MKRLFLLGAVLLLPFLTACSGLLGAIIGEREVNNLYGLNDHVVELPLPSIPSGQITPAQTGVSFPLSVPFETPVADVAPLNLPLGVAPISASEEIGMSRVIEFSGVAPEGAFPSSLSLAEVSLVLTFRDGSGSPIVQKTLQDTARRTYTFNKSSCQLSGDRTVCQYETTSQEDIFFFPLEFEGEEFDTLFNDILQGGEPVNNVAGNFRTRLSVSIPSSLAVPNNGVVKLTLKSRNGKVRFG
jgi:hypothetical protein